MHWLVIHLDGSVNNNHSNQIKVCIWWKAGAASNFSYHWNGYWIYILRSWNIVINADPHIPCRGEEVLLFLLISLEPIPLFAIT